MATAAAPKRNLRSNRLMTRTETEAELERELKQEQIAKRRLECQLLELELSIKNGEYIKTEEVKARETVLGAFMRRWALGLETELAPRVVGLTEKEVRTVVHGLVRNALTRGAALLGADVEDP